MFARRYVRRCVLVVLLAVIPSLQLYADEVIEAYTVDGKGVLLRQGGSWEYSGIIFFFDVEQNEITSIDNIPISELLPCVVTEVIDGDTIKVEIANRPPGILQEESVRLLGVDAPELRSQDHIPAAEEALAFVTQRVSGSSVYLAFESRWRDSFGRLLAYVFTGSSAMLNAELLSEGLASVYQKKPCYFHSYFVTLELAARQASLGIWSSDRPTDIVIQVVNEGRSEYVELWNSTDKSITLSGWYILDEQRHRIDIPPGTSIPSNGSLYILSGTGTESPSDNYVYPTRAFIWNNDGDKARLYDENKELAAEYRY